MFNRRCQGSQKYGHTVRSSTRPATRRQRTRSLRRTESSGVPPMSDLDILGPEDSPLQGWRTESAEPETKST